MKPKSKLHALLVGGATLLAAGALHAAPTPDPMTWDAVPVAISETEITMTATTANDAGGVEYYFTETSGNPGGDDSGWIPSPTYNDAGLLRSTTYSYTVKARELSGFTETAVSTPDAAATTDGAVIYESFADADSSLNGNTPGTGLSGTWSAAGEFTVLAGSQTYGSLPTFGNRTRNTGALRSAGVTPGPELATAGLLDDDAELWFSFLANSPQGGNVAWEFALATEQVNFFNGIDASNNGSGIGVAIYQGKTARAAIWPPTDSKRDEDGSSTGSMTTDTTALIVGRIIWGADGSADDTIELYMPATDLVLPASPVSSLSRVLDQSQFDTITFDGKDQDSPRVDEIRFGDSYADVVAWDFVTHPDNTAPTPDPMTFATAPTAVTDTSITMTADRAFDVSGVDDKFTCTSANAPDSGWQASRTYTVTGLTPSTLYTYTVTARDASPANNMTVASGPEDVTTFAVDNTPPTPDPMTFASSTAISNTAITMTADTATDNIYGVEYKFICTAGGGPDSIWQSSPTFTATGLTPATSYTYTVTARDTGPNLNEGTASDPESTSTLPTDNTAPTPDPATWATAPTAVSDTEITMTATAATDDQYGVEYYFANLSVVDGSHDSGWLASPTYNDTGLNAFTSYTYQVRVRDTSYAQNAGAGSDALPAVTDADPTVTDPSLIEGPFYIVGSQNAPTENLDFKVSVFDGKAFYAGQGNYPGNVSLPVFSHFGDGTVLDYRFFNENPNDVIGTYAAGSVGLIANATTSDTGLNGASWANVWNTSDPGYDFAANPADFASSTMFIDVTGTPAVEGSVNISGMTEGIIYFIYGAYRNTPNIAVTMSGSGQDDVTLTGVGNNDGANNNEIYVVAVNFVNAADYGTISWDFNSSNGRFLGVVLDGESTPVASSPYDDWAADPLNSFLGILTDPTPSLDFDNGGLATGVEWVVAGDPTDGSDDASVAPVLDNTTDPDFLIFTYRRSAAANADTNTAIEAEYGTDLSGWTTAVAGADILINATTDGGGSGIDLVEVKIRRSAFAVGGKLFARLNVVITP